jgi:N-acetyl-anhydromuramyl-L-alanine amidase AmpD
MASAEAACRRLCDPASGVSCHYLVDEHGGIVQMVEEDMRAWHAGQSFWHGETDINSRSIGIEIHNRGHEADYPDFPEAQMAAVIALCRDILGRHAIAPERVLAHSDIAPRRKLDPGEKFGPDDRCRKSRKGAMEESPGSTETRCRVTPGGGDPRESATESKPLPRSRGSKGERVR